MFTLTTRVLILDLWEAIEGLNRAEKARKLKNRIPSKSLLGEMIICNERKASHQSCNLHQKKISPIQRHASHSASIRGWLTRPYFRKEKGRESLFVVVVKRACQWVVLFGGQKPEASIPSSSHLSEKYYQGPATLTSGSYPRITFNLCLYYALQRDRTYN